MNNQAKNIREHARFMELWLSRKPEVERLYYQESMTQKVLANHYKVSQGLMCRIMQLLEIQARSRGKRGEQHHHFKDGKSSVIYRTLIVKNLCEMCGSTAHLTIHHRNNDHYDNRVENLAVMCNHCHISQHKKMWWAAKKAGLSLPKSNAPAGWGK